MIKLHNTMTGKLEEFKPINEGRVSLYVCGPTVYNYFHIGNARVFVVFDVIRRYLRYSGYKVTFVQNITDIEDKIINRAKTEGVTWQEIVARYTDAYFEDTARLKVERPDVSPRATEEIPGMLKMIQTLMDKGYAYAARNGVYYSVDKFQGYGKLSHRNIDDLVEGARVEVDEEKKNPLDFALWKFSKPGEPSWESPWGAGRPGWHIECSVMSSKYLSDTFDMHGGGADLVFPHHENEIAQSEAATGRPFVNYWLHGGYMNIRGEKMSKSKGNFVTVRDILNDYSAEVLRMFILSAQYRGPLDFSYENVDAVKAGFKELYYTLQRLDQRLAGYSGSAQIPADNGYIAGFKEAMDFDFNTAMAQGVLYKCISALKGKINRITDDEAKVYDLVIREICGIMGVTPEIKPVDKGIYDLVQQIDNLRKDKRYEEADIIRKQVSESGYLLEFSNGRTFVIREMK